MNKNICNNCGKNGHTFYQCKLPITSNGIILFRKKEKEIQYLMIRRKDSFGFIDFIRGKYSPYNIFQIQNLVNEMSNTEKQKILTETFEELWQNMWCKTNNSQYKTEYFTSLKKYETIKGGIEINNININLRGIIDKSQTSWLETEWEFPKGRRNYKEKDLECAMREFEEETGISQTKIIIVENVVPFEEIFIGSNHKSYKHKYFLAYINDTEDYLDNFQVTEVSKIEWKNIDQCLEAIRPYNLEKKKIITSINKLLEEYKIY